MRKLLAFLLVVALVGCDNGNYDTLQGFSASDRERQITFRFDRLSRTTKPAPGQAALPAFATDLRFIGRDAGLNVLFETKEPKDEEFTLKTKPEVTQIEVQVLAGEVVVLASVLEVPSQPEVAFTNPLLDPVAYQGGTGITVDPPSVQIAVDGTVSFQSFLSSATQRIPVTGFSTFESSDVETMAFSDEQRDTARGVKPGQVTVTGSYGVPRAEIMVAASSGPAQVRTLDATNTQPGILSSLFAFEPAVTGGISIATADFNGDGVVDFVVGCRSASTRVRVIDGSNHRLIREFEAFGPDFQGGVRVATGELNGDGKPDIVVAAGPGGLPKVRLFDGQTAGQLDEFLVFDASFIGGVNVAAGDFNHDGRDDIVVGAGTGGPSRVRVLDGAGGTLLKEFFAFQQQFVGGVRVATGDVNGDGQVDIITGAGPGSLPEVRVFDGQSANPIGEFFAYQPDVSGGVFVAAADLDGDKLAEIIVGPGAESAAPLRVFKGLEGDQLAEIFPFGQSFQAGVCVAGLPALKPRLVLRAESQVVVGTQPLR